jgi:hypothetical protein
MLLLTKLKGRSKNFHYSGPQKALVFEKKFHPKNYCKILTQIWHLTFLTSFFHDPISSFEHIEATNNSSQISLDFEKVFNPLYS